MGEYITHTHTHEEGREEERSRGAEGVPKEVLALKYHTLSLFVGRGITDIIR